jgi:molybdate transport system substrate-binding protein
LAATLAIPVLQAQPSAAAALRVMSSGAPGEVVKGLTNTFSADTGHRVLLTIGTIDDMQRRLLAGEKPDLIILPAPVIAGLDKAGTLEPGGRADLARVGIGVAVREGAALPDISTADAVRAMLTAARSIVYPDPVGGGFAGAQVARMVARLGIAEAVKPKVSYMFAIGGGTAAVANGDAEIGLFNISEIMPAVGVTLVGPLPTELQSYITFSGAIRAGGTSPDIARAFLQALAGPQAHDLWKKGGFEPIAP